MRSALYMFPIQMTVRRFFNCSSSLKMSLISTDGSKHKLRNEAMKSRIKKPTIFWWVF